MSKEILDGQFIIPLVSSTDTDVLALGRNEPEFSLLTIESINTVTMHYRVCQLSED